MTVNRITGPECAVMCNLTNAHACTFIYSTVRGIGAALSARFINNIL